MRRTTSALVLTLTLLGCGSAAPKGDPVELLTGVDADACYAGGEWGWGVGCASIRSTERALATGP